MIAFFGPGASLSTLSGLPKVNLGCTKVKFYFDILLGLVTCLCGLLDLWQPVRPVAILKWLPITFHEGSCTSHAVVPNFFYFLFCLKRLEKNLRSLTSFISFCYYLMARQPRRSETYSHPSSHLLECKLGPLDSFLLGYIWKEVNDRFH